MPGKLSAQRLCRFLPREGTQLALKQAKIEEKEALLEKKHWWEEGKIVEAEQEREVEEVRLVRLACEVNGKWGTSSEDGDEGDGSDRKEL